MLGAPSAAIRCSACRHIHIIRSVKSAATTRNSNSTYQSIFFPQNETYLHRHRTLLPAVDLHFICTSHHSHHNLFPSVSDHWNEISMATHDNWIPMGGGIPHPKYCPNRKDYIVTFSEPHDPLNPKNWTTRKKYAIHFKPLPLFDFPTH